MYRYDLHSHGTVEVLILESQLRVPILVRGREVLIRLIQWELYIQISQIEGLIISRCVDEIDCGSFAYDSLTGDIEYPNDGSECIFNGTLGEIYIDWGNLVECYSTYLGGDTI